MKPQVSWNALQKPVKVGKGLDDPALIAEAEKRLAELEPASKDQ